MSADTSSQGQSNSACPPLACREKYWEELDDAGKIARLRQIVKQLEHRVESLSKTASDAGIVARDHQHSADGTVLMPVDSFNRNGSAEVGRRRDEKYF